MTSAVALHNPNLVNPIRKGLVVWFVIEHAMGFSALLYLNQYFDWRTVTMAVVLFFATHIAITAGPHRLYSHKSYEARAPLQLYLLAMSAAAFQWSSWWWGGKHRQHHWFSDTEKDPYTVLHGFWWAHIGWMLYTPFAIPKSAMEMGDNKLVRFQHAYYIPIALVFGFGLPTALGALWGDWLRGLLVGGFLRLLVQYHLTWIINSVAHSCGHRRYPGTATARTNMWLALFTVGESYHERHHLAPEDYRLGNRWYDIDPGKWFIYLCSLVGLAYNLKRVSEDEVTRRAEALVLKKAAA